MRQFQEYVKPDEGAAAQGRRTMPAATPADSDGAVGASSSLGDNTLIVNLGIPIVVVLTKVSIVYSSVSSTQLTATNSALP